LNQIVTTKTMNTTVAFVVPLAALMTSSPMVMS
jgi:hypothetical protein